MKSGLEVIFINRLFRIPFAFILPIVRQKNAEAVAGLSQDEVLALIASLKKVVGALGGSPDAYAFTHPQN